MYFDRGDLPIKMEYLTGGDKIGWTVISFSNCIMEFGKAGKNFKFNSIDFFGSRLFCGVVGWGVGVEIGLLRVIV